MAADFFAIPNHRGNAIDIVYLDPTQTDGDGFVHYAYAIVANNPVERRKLPWVQIQQFQDPSYQSAQRQIIERLQDGSGYRPGELGANPQHVENSELNTTIRLGALELLGNIASGRLMATTKDPFPHQLALQQFMKRSEAGRSRRLLIADEVGLGKTIEAGLIIRDLLLAEGRLDQFSCLYLTSGGLLDDAAEKLRDVLQGAVGDQRLVETVESFRRYGQGGTRGVHVASMHAARRYVSERAKQDLPDRVAPSVLVIDECHHAACADELGGKSDITATMATQTYKAAHQLISGTFWRDSAPPKLVVLMSATPFRSKPQFVNLLRLLAHGYSSRDGAPVASYPNEQASAELLHLLRDESSGIDVVWRRQDDEEVRSWSKQRLFPDLKIVRPHDVDESTDVPLQTPGPHYLDLLKRITHAMRHIAGDHGSSFGGFATAQLEKKLTSSSITGACSLFSWCVRHNEWDTKEQFRADRTEGTQSLRRLIKKISQKLAAVSQSESQHANVRFESESFEFAARSLAQRGQQHVDDIFRFHKQLRSNREPAFEIADFETVKICALAEEILDFGRSGVGNSERPIEIAKLDWLRQMLERHDGDKFLLFTESLQTAEIIRHAFGSQARRLIGSMGEMERRKAVRDLRTMPNVRLLVATSAADEGFDLQVANRVVHWDLSSSPATFMQRNGRVARLGQRVDVTAYYLILPGTHEERRDSRLRDTFAALGIDDDLMRNKILGMLDADALDQLDTAIAQQDDKLVGTLLKQAKDDNEAMERQLSESATRMRATSVLDRGALAERIRHWKKLGLPDVGVDVEMDTIDWEKPVFGDYSGIEPCQSDVATLRRGSDQTRIVFDPELMIFGSDSSYGLAGLRPWISRENQRGNWMIRPDALVDPLGALLCSLARCDKSDFGRIARESLVRLDQRFIDTQCLLFCTHPIREAETERLDPEHERPYLTFYPFSQSPQSGIVDTWASAEQVHECIKLMERDLLEGRLSPRSTALYEEARKWGEELHAWLSSVTRYFRATFLEAEQRFLPVPVALVLVA